MPTVYPTAAGAWSTRTWNDDATGAAYGGPPLAGDIVKANGLSITIDVNITVAELQTSVGTFAAAGGSFSTSGTRTINSDVRAGTTNCLTLAGGSSSVLNGNSYGSTTTNSVFGVIIGRGCTQNGNSFGGAGGIGRIATQVQGRGLQVGTAFGGDSFNTSVGTQIAVMGRLQGDSYGSTVTNGAPGASINTGGTQIGNAYGRRAEGSLVGGILFGNAIGSNVTGESFPGVTMSTGGIFIGDAIAGTVGEGAFSNQNGSVMLINNATRTGTPWAARSITNPSVCLVKAGVANVSTSPSDITITDAAIANLHYPWINAYWNPSTGGIPIGRLISGGV